MLSIINECTRECRPFKVSRNLASEDVINMLSEQFAMCRVLRASRSDNGPEFTAGSIRGWLVRTDIQTPYIAPGSP